MSNDRRRKRRSATAAAVGDRMDTVAERIRGHLGSLTAKERRVAHVMLANYPVAGLQTVANLANQAGVSSPTVLRFLGRIGYGSHAGFQSALRGELEAQLKSPLAKTPPAAASTALSSAIADFAEAVADNVGQTFAHLPVQEFESVVDLLADEKRRIHTIGGRFTDALARYLSAHLRILRGGVGHLAGQEANWRDQLIDMGRRDVLVVFDVRRYQDDLLRLANAAAERQVSVVLITDQWLSPVARIAAHVLSARIAVPSAWDSAAALMALSEALLAAVTRRSWQRSEQRLSAIEELRGSG